MPLLFPACAVPCLADPSPLRLRLNGASLRLLLGGALPQLAVGPQRPLAFGVPLRQHAVWLPPGGCALRRLVAGPRPPLASAVPLRRLSAWPRRPTAVFPPRLVAGLWPLPFSGALPAAPMAHSTLRQCSDRDARSAHGRRSFEHRDDAENANRHTDAVR